MKKTKKEADYAHSKNSIELVVKKKCKCHIMNLILKQARSIPTCHIINYVNH